MSSRRPPTSPVVAIIGATGTGKSRLAVELATKFDGEVINCDALQLYEGLPVITNKITEEERNGIPHHLLGCIGLDRQAWTVGDFIPKALETIAEIRNRGRLPILVGGTHYYIQSLLVHESTVQEAHLDPEHQGFPFLESSTPELIKMLREVDPVMADRWHPNERRKIQRSLEIYFETGKPASEVYAAQTKSTSTEEANTRSETKNNSLLRFDPLVFWVSAPDNVLRQRLDSRVGTMLDAGMISEIERLAVLHAQRAAAGDAPDLSRGIWVAIGYKEFSKYIAALHLRGPEEKLSGLRDDAIERTKISTRQYAKRQLQWIHNRFLGAMGRAGASGQVFLLQNTDMTLFIPEVEEIGEHLTRTFLTGEELPNPLTLSEAAREVLVPKKRRDVGQNRAEWVRNECAPCGKTTVTKEQWEQHEGSNRHRKAVAAAARRRTGGLNWKESSNGPTG